MSVWSVFPVMQWKTTLKPLSEKTRKWNVTGDIFYCLIFFTKSWGENFSLTTHLFRGYNSSVHTVKIRKFKLLYFKNERRYGARNFVKDLFLGHLQPGVDKNWEGLAVLIIEFDDVMVKHSVGGYLPRSSLLPPAGTLVTRAYIKGSTYSSNILSVY